MLLSGANGAGKTTLLQILAGKTMVDSDAVRVIGKPPFHDISLTCSGELGYLGSQWRRNIGSAVRATRATKAPRRPAALSSRSPARSRSPILITPPCSFSGFRRARGRLQRG